jgi:hypothetical protein
MQGLCAGVVNLFGSSSCRMTHGHSWSGSVGSRCRVSGGRGQSGDLVPRSESDGHLPTVLLSGEPVTAWPKVRGYSAERGEESLRVSRLGEAFHGSFALAGGLVGVLGRLFRYFDWRCPTERRTVRCAAP